MLFLYIIYSPIIPKNGRDNIVYAQCTMWHLKKHTEQNPCAETVYTTIIESFCGERARYYDDESYIREAAIHVMMTLKCMRVNMRITKVKLMKQKKHGTIIRIGVIDGFEINYVFFGGKCRQSS